MSDYDLIGNIIAYEMNELDDAGTIVLFSYLIKTGRAWKLQGHYGQIANILIENKTISKDGEILIDIDYGEGDEDEE